MELSSGIWIRTMSAYRFLLVSCGAVCIFCGIALLLVLLMISLKKEDRHTIMDILEGAT